MTNTKYILAPEIALRGWRIIPWAYCIRGAGQAYKLSQEEFDILMDCDGETAITSSPQLDALVERGLCVPAENSEKLTSWQKYRFCDNRYFPAVNWAITGKCNLNCRHCFNAADNEPLMSEFSWEQCQDFIRQMDECGVHNVTLTGGEPMLHPRFMDICREVERRGMFLAEITTNGTFITREMLEVFETFFQKPLFKVSFDGVGYHDRFRDKPGAERTVLDAIQLLCEKGFSVHVQTNVCRENTDTILLTARLLESLGVDGMRVIRTSESPRLVQVAGDIALGIDEYYDFALDFIRRFLRDEGKMPIDLWQVIRIFPENMFYFHSPITGDPLRYRDSIPVCRGARGQIAVTPEGDLLPCNQASGYFKKHDLRMGNVHETTLRELLSDSEYLRAVCYTVGELRKENPKCQACPHWRLCMGGCRVAGLLLGGSYTAYDPIKCVYFDNYTEHRKQLPTTSRFDQRFTG